ncbi:hypothetical protein [Mammaliicoccus lentus]|nr:hypothetical protein [Mammaliicoccus lentus]MBF0793765.1 hypothetical protein [Mammaliicoccus lentus]
MRKTKEDLLIDKIKELQEEYENNPLMTKLILEFEITKYFEEVYKKG